MGPSVGSLCAHLWPLWQHRVAMLVFRGPRGGIWRPNVLKVTSGHVALCAITIAKTDVFTECHFFWKFTPKSPPRAPKSYLWMPFWRHLGSRCRLFGVPWGMCGTPGAHCGFRGISWGRASAQKLAGSRGTALWRGGKTALGPPGRGFYSGNTHIQQSCGMCPQLSKSLK